METLAGTATYLERIAMPPGVTFEVRLEDVSRMDAPAHILSTVTVNAAGNPPYDFTIPYNPEIIQEARRYTLRASLRLGARLLFTTDTHIPVLTNGAGSEVAITMVQAQTPTEPPRRMIGAFVYFADAATFTECATGNTYPVAMESAYLEAERAYLKARSEPMAPVAVVLEGQIAPREGMEGGTRDMLVIDRLAGAVPGLNCERAMADADVENTYWRILSIAGNLLKTPEASREPRIILRPGEGAFTSSVGCNTINGSYTRAGSGLSLGAGPMTMMACPPPLDESERAWTRGIASVSAVIVTGPTMEMLAADGTTVAFLEAVALP
ncbi:MAG: YbaY family lipoprotein [Paracoccaceae bacterium]